MKKVVSALTAAAMCASMAAGVMSVFAAYTPDEITYSLEVVSEGDKYTVDGNTITFASAADANGATFTVAHYIDCDNSADKQDFVMAGARVMGSDEAIKLSKAVSATDGTYSEARTETINGIECETTYFTYCFGTVGKRTGYAPLCAWTNAHSSEFTADYGYEGPEQSAWVWQYFGTAASATLLGETSRDYPLTQFDVTLGELADGTYTIDFVEDLDGNIATFMQGADGVPYTPTLKSLTIVVGSGETEPTTEEPTTEEPTTEEPTTEPPVVEEGFRWDIADIELTMEEFAECVDGDLAYVEVPVYVYGDPGTAGFKAFVNVNGGSVADSDISIDAITKGNAYAAFDVLEGNIANGGVVGSKTEGEIAAADGATIFNVWFAIDPNVAEGTVYKLTLSDLDVVNAATEQVTPAPVEGYIQIGEVGETEPTTEEPTTEEPTTEEPTTEEPTTEDPEQPTDDQSYLYGDVNKNGVVELVDIVMLNRNLTGYGNQTLDAYQTEVADCWDDGVLTGRDSMEILKALIGYDNGNGGKMTTADLPTAAN